MTESVPSSDCNCFSDQVGDTTTFPMPCMIIIWWRRYVMQDTNTLFYVVPPFLMALQIL